MADSINKVTLNYLDASSYTWNTGKKNNLFDVLVTIAKSLRAFFKGHEISISEGKAFIIPRNNNTYVYKKISSFLNKVSKSTGKNYSTEGDLSVKKKSFDDVSLTDSMSSKHQVKRSPNAVESKETGFPENESALEHEKGITS